MLNNLILMLLGSIILYCMFVKRVDGFTCINGSTKEWCSKLTRKNCGKTSCCVWTSDDKCGSGSVRGPTYNTDEKGNTRPLDYYYFQNKCYGAKCPSNLSKIVW